MRYVLIAAIVGLASTSAVAAEVDAGFVVAKRLVAAIDGTSAFKDADFVKPLGASDKAALRRFGACNVDLMSYPPIKDPQHPGAEVYDPSEVSIIFACPKVPAETPAGLTLHLDDGRIASVETHNADLLVSK